jgi:hypothetical protein
MKVRIYNNDSSDYVDYEASTIEQILHMAQDRIKQPGWDRGHSEVLEGEDG